MSDDGSMASGAPEIQDTDATLYSASGEPLRSTSGSMQTDQLADFVKATAIGCFLGRPRDRVHARQGNLTIGQAQRPELRSIATRPSPSTANLLDHL
jgi:hypothetical protein